MLKEQNRCTENEENALMGGRQLVH